MECEKLRDRFCVLCTRYSPQKLMYHFTGYIVSLYDTCFPALERKSVDFINDNWVPKTICSTCEVRLRRWNIGETQRLYESPAVWHEPTNHTTDCFFCANESIRGNKYQKRFVQYILKDSVTMPILEVVHVNAMNIDMEPEVEAMDMDRERVDEDGIESECEGKEGEEEGEDQTCYTCGSCKFSQAELNDVIRDAGLSKSQAEILASRLQEKKLLSKRTKVTFYRDRDKNFRKYFSTQDSLVYCNNIKGLINEYGAEDYVSMKWRLFIDSSKHSLKAVLLHNGNKLASIPIGYSRIMKENYDYMEVLLRKINYAQHRWKICSDIKVITIILGQQTGFTKYMCFLCEWDSRAREKHYVQKVWPKRIIRDEKFEVGKKNIIAESLVNPANVLLPPLHIQLGMVKQLVKALQKRKSKAFAYLSEKFPKLSEGKIKEGIFDGPQIRQLISDQIFSRNMDLDEKKAWESFIQVKQKFLGNFKDPGYAGIVSNCITNFQVIGCLMSLKIHMLDSHLDWFPDNLGDFSEEQGERFHQDITQMEKRYQGFETENVNMLADYCWNLKRDDQQVHKRKALTRSFEERCRPKKKARLEELY